jgi:glycosyltransferase involved in cell wall biosynthesis
VKILQVIPTLDPSVGGVVPAVLSLSRGLMRRGNEVEVVVLDDASAPWLSALDLPVHAVGWGLTNYGYSRKLDDWLKEHAEKYERVIVNGMWQYPGFAVWRRLARSRVPYYLFPHGMLDPWFKRTYPLKHVKKWFYWPWAEYRVMRDAAAVIFTSEQERIEARKSFWLYHVCEKVSPLGIDPPAPVTPEVKEELFRKFPQLRNKRLLLFLGRLHPKKGCDLAIEAFAKVANRGGAVSVVFGGPDQIGWQKELGARAQQLGIGSSVVFTGMLDANLKQSALANAEALILPSHQENFGMAVVEALAARVPVLISDRINIWQEIQGDDAGYVAPDDLAGTTSLLQRWYDTPGGQKEQMRRNAGECFSRRFEINRAVDSLLKILSEPVPSN